jgi:hypothetical protein
VYNSRVILSSYCRHGSPTVKNAVRTARLAWHDTIAGKDVDKEFDAIDKLDRRLSPQVWLPEYDPGATDTDGADP